MSKVVLITGGSSGFGRLMAEALAKAGHKVYGSMRQTKSRNPRICISNHVAGILDQV